MDEKRYCGSCPDANHHEDGFIRCSYLQNYNLDKKCPHETEESYRHRLKQLELCPTCKEHLGWEDFYLGKCRNCGEHDIISEVV